MERSISWEDDKLNRWKQAAFITSFLENEFVNRKKTAPEKCSFVLNIDSQWGYGKTFFLSRWKSDLETKGHIVLYYDAWKNDFSKDPLISFLSEIAPQLLSKIDHSAHGNAERIERFKKDTKKLLKSATGIITKRLLSAGLSSIIFGLPRADLLDNLNDFHDDSDNNTGGDSDSDNENPESPEKLTQQSIERLYDSLSDDIFDEQNSRKRIISDFKDSLSAIIESISKSHDSTGSETKLPIYVFIDELDRCRPDFTIELIECVKHIFSVNNIFFVFATDGKQLQSALSGTYGNNFDAETYFKRVFDREVHLQEPDNETFAIYLKEKYLKDVDNQYALSVHGAKNHRQARGIESEIAGIAQAFNLSLRDQHQITMILDSLIKGRTQQRQKTYTLFSVFIITIWIKRKILFQGMYRHSHYKNYKELHDELKKHFPDYNGSIEFILPTFGFVNSEVTTLSLHEIICKYMEILHTPIKDRKAELRASNLDQDKEPYIFSELDDEIFRLNESNPNDHPLRTHFQQVMYF